MPFCRYAMRIVKLGVSPGASKWKKWWKLVKEMGKTGDRNGENCNQYHKLLLAVYLTTRIDVRDLSAFVFLKMAPPKWSRSADTGGWIVHSFHLAHEWVSRYVQSKYIDTLQSHVKKKKKTHTRFSLGWSWLYSVLLWTQRKWDWLCPL
jgi:hypothetical protein